MLCHHAEVAKDIWYCNYGLCFLHCDWQLENSPQKAININEAREIIQTSPDPLLLGGVRAQDWETSNLCSIQLLIT